MIPRKFMAALAVGAACAGFVPAAMAGASAPPGSAAGGDYCAAHVALEAAFNGDDPTAIGPAVAAAQAAAPAEIQDALAAAIANSPTDGPPTAEFTDAYNTVLDWVAANCGFNELDVLAQEYSFGGVGGEVAAGTTVIRLDNQGTEYHEFDVIRKNDGVTASAQDILALPEDEAMTQVTDMGSAFAAPGSSGGTVIDLTPGDYFAVCFIPQGTTPEALEQMMAAGSDSTPASTAPEGPPHFTLGMIVEFTVVEGGTTDTGSMVPMDHSTMEMATATTAG